MVRSSLVVSLLVALGSLAYAQSVYLRVEISAPRGNAAPVADLKPFQAPAMSLAERTAIQQMWTGMESQVIPIARDCQMAIEVSIDATSFRGHLVSGTDDGLHPGTRARFRDVARALTAVCNRGDAQRSAVQSSVRGIRFGFTTASEDTLALQGGTLVFQTNGDLSNTGHLGYARAIDAIMGVL